MLIFALFILMASLCDMRYRYLLHYIAFQIKWNLQTYQLEKHCAVMHIERFSGGGEKMM
ncbi:hypothetical protein KsCSTR_19280 [Candidatus Kuenenia stuttgartiensis]|uniref:Uncharacterized protein n=1 Tax=Kuenenia stuttgartiensis TaxID=174633 RepID=Q1Q2H7_KUEST|nr:hypothetical protein KsCSTR_19280 [Candidatus Kuenenia stuttgartiensis]CAJ74211.1 unknown protein [Candidatus Kuenenia stuttgartiensis]